MTPEHKEKIREAAKARSEAKKAKEVTPQMVETHKIKELLLNFIIPPPVYKQHITTDQSNRVKTIGIVESIVQTPAGFKVTALTGEAFHVPLSQVQYWKE